MLLVCSGCALTQEEAVTIAKAEITRRKLPLPRDHTIVAAKSTAFVEGSAPDQPVYIVVTFAAPSAAGPSTLYEVSVDMRTKSVDSVGDFVHARR
jgi:hypothetical protein